MLSKLTNRAKIMLSVAALFAALLAIGLGLYFGVFNKSHPRHTAGPTVRPTNSLRSPDDDFISPYTVFSILTSNKDFSDIGLIDFDRAVSQGAILDGNGKNVTFVQMVSYAGLCNTDNTKSPTFALGMHEYDNIAPLIANAMTKASKIGKKYTPDDARFNLNCKISANLNQFNNLISNIKANKFYAVCYTEALISQLTSRIKSGTVIDNNNETFLFDNCDSLILPVNFIEILPHGKSYPFYKSELSKLY